MVSSLATASASHLAPWRLKLILARASAPSPSSAVMLAFPELVVEHVLADPEAGVGRALFLGVVLAGVHAARGPGAAVGHVLGLLEPVAAPAAFPLPAALAVAAIALRP